MKYITLGRIVGTFGVKGEVKVYSSSHFSLARYKKNNSVYLLNEKTNERIELTINTYKKGKAHDIISFNEYKSLNEVESLQNFLVQISEENATLPKNYYHYYELMDCLVYDESNNLLGRVKTVEEYASYQTLRIQRENNKDILVPFVKAFIKKVDIDNHKIIIHVLEGLLWK